jgi:hypothetical protein
MRRQYWLVSIVAVGDTNQDEKRKVIGPLRVLAFSIGMALRIRQHSRLAEDGGLAAVGYRQK